MLKMFMAKATARYLLYNSLSLGKKESLMSMILFQMVLETSLAAMVLIPTMNKTSIVA